MAVKKQMAQLLPRHSQRRSSSSTEPSLDADPRADLSDKPFIIDAIVSAGELTMPPHIELSQVWGFGHSKVKEGLMGLAGDHGVWKSWRDGFKVNL
jgi:pyruvate dehydrogenase (quinone)